MRPITKATKAKLAPFAKLGMPFRTMLQVLLSNKSVCYTVPADKQHLLSVRIGDDSLSLQLDGDIATGLWELYLDMDGEQVSSFYADRAIDLSQVVDWLKLNRRYNVAKLVPAV